MFKYKTEADLSAMTAEQRDTYAEQKRAFEASATKAVVDAAIAEVEKKIPTIPAPEVTKAEFQEVKEAVNVIKENTGGASKTVNFWDVVEKSLIEALPQLKAMKAQAEGTKGKELTIEVKAAVSMTAAVTAANASSVTTPDAVVYNSVSSYATDVRKEQYIINYLSNGNTDKPSLPYMDKLPNQGTMAVTAEGALKPLISISFELRYSTATKIAGRTKVSEEALDDIPFLMSAIKNELKYEHDIAEQAAVFTKIAAIAPGFTAGSLAATTDNATNYDAIRAAIYAVRIASKGKYTPNAVLVPSADAYAMGAAKDTTNQYVFPPFVMPDGSKVSGVQVIEVADGSTVADGAFIVGDFRRLHRDVYKAFTVRIGQGIQGNSTAANIVSDFESNMYTLIGESRLHLWIYENEKTAFIKSTFAAVKTAIETA